MTAALGRWGTADADDFLTPIDDLVAQGLVDPARLAVTGYSYGGYMQSSSPLAMAGSRWAVPGGVVADSHSVATTSDMGLLLAVKEMGGLPWTDRDASTRCRRCTSSIGCRRRRWLQGAADVRCPVSEAQRWFTAGRGPAACRASWSSIRGPRTCSSSTAAPHTAPTGTAASSTGCIGMPARLPPRTALALACAQSWTPPTGSTG